MPASTLVLSSDFAWLSPSCRPSPREVEAYAHLIRMAEHTAPQDFAACLREAELQLWIWRHDARRRAPLRRRATWPRESGRVHREPALSRA